MSDGTMTAVEGQEPIVAYRFMTAGGEVLAEHRPEETFVPASTLKLAVLVAAVRALAEGGLRLDQKVPAVSSWPSRYDGAPFRFDGDEADPQWPTDDRPMELGLILERMIVVSSNEAANVVYDLVGADSIAQVFTDAGCRHSALRRRYGDLRAARHQGVMSACTAADLAVLMAAVVTGRLADPKRTAVMTELLSRQQDAVIGAAVSDVLGDTAAWGSKSGWLTGIRHDVAYIGPPGEQSLILAVCTQGFADAPSAVAAVRALTRGLLQLRQPSE